MDKKSQAKNALVDMIKAKMDELGWKQGALAEASGVSQSIISRFLKGPKEKKETKGISGINLSSILTTLNLLKDGSEPTNKDAQLKYDKIYKENVELLKDYKNLSKDYQKLLDCFVERENFINTFKGQGEKRRKCDNVELTPLKKTL